MSSIIFLTFLTLVRSFIKQRFLKVIKSSQFESAVDVILVLNAVVVTIQSWPLLVGDAVTLNETYLDGTCNRACIIALVLE
jgi:hypothetical protein